MRKFFEQPDGGSDYIFEGLPQTLTPLAQNEVIGFGYEFDGGNIFFTRKGERLSDAFVGRYTPTFTDIYAAVGVCGETEVHVNFGEHEFLWVEGNNEEWSIKNHARNKRAFSSSGLDELPPAYQ
ncbi:hypothetical protein M422DRAFT_50392 [Sphaerobolus stellatus SS14]|uniref:B30.2/SPRY domain-containing protein n=1 Tax=Sphaerobolus stellatus (strain SS14) TaxID=990650 RepID=A0A0C9URY9_SPHS4|nr:hypothetical protein M422DRAFT_50392 [Sphaerobolus stellatus SS14]